jgi:hypothetical protein
MRSPASLLPALLALAEPGLAAIARREECAALVDSFWEMKA